MRSPRLLLTGAVVAGTLVASTLTGPGTAATPSAESAVATARAAAQEAGPGEGRYGAPVVKAHRLNPSNPLANRQWGVYTGPMEQSWAPYERARGANKDLLAEIALRPKTKWFGRFVSPGDIERHVREYVRISQQGNPRALVQMALFGMAPWTEDGGTVCRRAPTKAEAQSYKRWIRGAVRGIGDSHSLVVLQPDLLIALRCGPNNGAGVARLVAWASKELATRPNTSTYIDVGAWDWPHPGQGGAAAAATFLQRTGIRHARGFAMNATHYSPTNLEVTRAAEIARILTQRGIRDKKAIISTSSNGKGFEFGKYQPQSSRDNARTCTSKTDKRMCVMMGIPPTADVDDPRWGLSNELRRKAATHVDGYVWFGRPWLFDQADPFVPQRAYDLVRSWRLRPGTS